MILNKTTKHINKSQMQKYKCLRKLPERIVPAMSNAAAYVEVSCAVVGCIIREFVMIGLSKVTVNPEASPSNTCIR